jgi:hypothetical protein
LGTSSRSHFSAAGKSEPYATLLPIRGRANRPQKIERAASAASNKEKAANGGLKDDYCYFGGLSAGPDLLPGSPGTLL